MNLLRTHLPHRKPKKQLTVAQLKKGIIELEYGDKHAELSGKKFYFWLRNAWGIGLVVVLGASIFFEYYLTYKVGTGQWKFVGSETFLNIIAGQMFIQIIGLCTIVLRALFPERPKS